MNLEELLDTLKNVAIPGPDTETILWSAISNDSLRKLGEMRLVALHRPDDPDALGILGITELGRTVLIGLLYAMDSGLRYSGVPDAAVAFRSKDRALNPAVHMRVIARDTTDPSAIFRVIEGIIPADVAAEWGEFLAKAAERAPHDVAAMEKRS